MPKVCCVTWMVAHYRVGIYRRLSQNRCFDFAVLAGDNTTVAGGTSVASGTETGGMEGINWRCVLSRRIRGPLFRNYEWQPEVPVVVWRERPDVVICSGNKSLSNWLLRVVCRLRGIPLVEWTMGVRGPEHGLKWAVRRFYMKWAKAHLVYGECARKFYCAHGFREEDVFAVHNSLDHDTQVEVRKTLSAEDIRRTREGLGATDSTDRIVVCSGRLDARKKIDLLLTAVACCKAVGRRCIVVLVGSGEAEVFLREHAAAKGIADQVRFVGACYDERRLGEIFSSADLCVIPGAAGLTIMHSMVYGTPVLTAENTHWEHGPEVEAVIEGHTGGFFKPDDVHSLAAKMQEMLFPEPCKDAMQDACMKKIETDYTPQYQERVIIEALNHVLPTEGRIRDVPAYGCREQDESRGPQ